MNLLMFYDSECKLIQKNASIEKVLFYDFLNLVQIELKLFKIKETWIFST